MATEEETGRTVAYASDQVDQLLRCPICLDRYNQPKILPCQHTICLTPCLQGLVDMRSRSVRCPECRIEHYVPARGADGFPTNRIVSNFLELQAQTIEVPTARSRPPEEPPAEENSAPPAEDPRKCGVCEKDAETTRCLHCNKLACETCRKTHFSQMKFDVGRLVSQIRRGIPNISKAISVVEQKSEHVKTQIEGVKSEVRDTVERYIKELRDREKMLCSELDTFMQGEQRNLRLHQENLEVDIASISSYCESTESRVNRAECDLSNEDLVNMKHQCSEYMTQLGTVENDAVPDTRTANFSFNGSSLHSSIINFGEVSVTDPITRTNSAPDIPTSTPSPASQPPTTRPTESLARRASVPAPNGPAHPPTSNHPPPTGPSRFNDQRSRGQVPSYTSPLNTPFINDTQIDQSSRSRPPWTRALSDVSEDIGSFYSDEVSPRTWQAMRMGYMFYNDPRQGLHRNDPSWNHEPSRARQNVSSMFGRDLFNREDRSSGFMGGSDDRPSGFMGGGGSAPPAVTRVVDSRPAISFSVGLGENGAMRARGRPPRNLSNVGRARGNANGSSQNSNQNQSTSRSRRAVPSSQNSSRGRGSSRAQKRPVPNRSGGSTFRADREEARNGENSTQSPEPQPGPSGEQASRLQARRGTYVREDDDDGDEDLERPTVEDEHDDDDDVVMGNTDSSNANLTHNESRAAVRPVHNYQRKGVMTKKLGGERGNGTGQFNWPRGVTVSPSNDSIVVADSSNHRVQIFDCNGVYVTAFGSYGNGTGEFDCLAGVAVNSTGQIIIADRYNHRVQIFDRYGTFQKQFGREGRGDGQLSYPWGVAVDYLGNIYVCDKENHRVQVFKADGTFIRKIGKLGNRNGMMENPHYLAVANDGRIIVSDTSNHRIQIFNSEGQHIMNIGSGGSEQGQLNCPKGIAVDQQGFIVVADSGNSRIQVFRSDGSFYCAFGENGTGPGQFKGLEGLALTSNGKIIVSDKENHRIQVF